MPPFAFFKGDFVPLSEAKVGIMTHALNYGTAVFRRHSWQLEPGRPSDLPLPCQKSTLSGFTRVPGYSI